MTQMLCQFHPYLKDMTEVLCCSAQVHERSVQSDFLLTILKDVVMRRSDLRLVLMSATVDCHKFSSYFNHCPIVSIPGRTFPVEVQLVGQSQNFSGY